MPRVLNQPTQIQSADQARRSSRAWREHFLRNRDNLLRLPWELPDQWTEHERRVLGPSLQVFQQGEAQSGEYFFRCAGDHALAIGDDDYVETHRLFMDEEKRHGRDLGRFLESVGVPILTSTSPLTRAFCWFGSRGGLEAMLRVIVICEMLALVYYAAIRRATQSPLLRRLCDQILRDEIHHIRFQTERLAILRSNRGPLRLWVARAIDRIFFGAAALVCWAGHRHALAAGGLGFLAFLTRAWAVFHANCRTDSQADTDRYSLAFSTSGDHR